MPNKLLTPVVLAAGLLSCVLAGCGTPGAGPWLNLPPEPPDNVSEAELFFTLISDPDQINQNRAYHAFLVWADGKDEAKNFGQRIAALEQRNLADPRWVHDPLKPLTRGRLASMICRKQNIRGSFTLASSRGPSVQVAVDKSAAQSQPSSRPVEGDAK